MENSDSGYKVMVVFLAFTLLSSSFTAFRTSAYAASPGTLINDFVVAGSGSLDVPKNLEFGPDGNLYVLSFQNDKIIRYNGTTGAFIDTFVTSGSGGLDGPQGLVFGPDGNLYVASEYTDQVLRYDGATGAFIDVYVTAGSGGLNNPQEMVFDGLGNLYVTSYFTHEVLRYASLTGLFIGPFVTAGSGGLDTPQGLEFGPDGNLYVVSENNPKVLRYDGILGSFIDAFATVGGGSSPKDLAFGPNGNLYVTLNTNDKVNRYNGTTGAFIDTFVTSGSGGLNSPQGLVFGTDDRLYVTSQSTDEILRYEGPFGISVTCNGKTVDEWESLGYTKFVGTSGDDVITGTSNKDIIISLDGNDNITANGGDDIICAGDGDDQVFGGSGDDVVHAGDGDNYVEGNSGSDIITTGSGNDTIYGGDGIDTITAGDGDNYIEGNELDDVISSGPNNDTIYGGSGDDTIDAGDGDNYIEGQQGADVITAGSGDDEIYGGNGNDTIDAGDGNNYVDGELGADKISAGSGDDEIYGSGGNDCINSTAGSDIIDGGSGNNLINTGSCEGIPIVDIVTPADGDSYVQGDSITFSGSATDPEDGGLSNIIFWNSSIDGLLGIGVPLTNSSLSAGIHTITASVNDSFGNTDSETHTITITPIAIDASPSISIISPTEGSIYTNVITITFSGSANDPEDGDLTASLNWSSNIEGTVGTGGTFTYSNLTVGTHTIEANVTDSFGNTKNDSIIMIITEDSKELVNVCHLPPGNPGNQQQLMIPITALQSHLKHGDYEGICINSDEEAKKQAKIALVKKQQEEMRNKNELKEKRDAFNEIKNELKDLKKAINEDKKQNIKTLVEDIKEVIKKLKEDPEYDKEHKKIIKDEIKEIKTEIINEIKTDAKILKHKVDSKITKLSKSDDPQYTAKKIGLDFENGKTQIAIELSGKDPAVIEYLDSIGNIDAKDDKHVQLTINLNDLPKLRTLGGIENIRPPFSAVQFEEELSEGVYFINADLAQFSGITGQGIKAAVLDLAFSNNPKITDNIVEVKSFRQGIGYLPIQGNDKESLHGTAVAEIISDVAPDVQLYLYSMETDIEFAAAVDEAISQQVDIIVMSAGWPNFPTDGTSHITKKIEHAVDNGIAFVVPAGNFANKHWEGTFDDSNLNNWHEFSNLDEGLTIEVTEERLSEETPIIAHLMWDVGTNDVADFELVLVDPLGQIVDYSANEQTTRADTTFEYIHYIPDIDGIYSIGVLFAGDMSNPSERPSASLEIFSVNDELEYPITKSSVSVPADAVGAIVVGAVNHLDGTLEPFSSQGPTNNGKLAPHVVGPDGVTTLSFDGYPFYGTSATAPYIAGLAALILQTSPDLTPQQLLHEIQQNTNTSLISLQDEFDYGLGYGSANAIFLVEEQEVVG